MNYALIEDNIVINVVVADLPLKKPWIASESASIGDIYNPADGSFTTPTEPVSRDRLMQLRQRQVRR